MSQRLPLEKLRAWDAVQFDMFIHGGMSTFTDTELPDGTQPPSTLHAPDKLDSQRGSVAKVWTAIPFLLPRYYRQELYDHIANTKSKIA